MARGKRNATAPGSHSRPPALARVAILAMAEPGARHDAIAHAAELATALRERRVDVAVLSDQPAPAGAQGEGWHALRLAIPGDATIVGRARAFCQTAVEHLSRLAQAGGRFHVAHGIQWSAAPAVRAVKQGGAEATALTFLDTVFSRRGSTNADALTAQMRRIEDDGAREADIVIAGNESARQELAWLYGTIAPRVDLLHAGALASLRATPAPRAAARTALAIPADAPVVVFGGAWSERGGSDLFLRAVALLRAARPGALFAAVAEGVAPARIEADLRRRGLAELVAVPMDSSAQSAWLDAANVVVVPSRDGSGDRAVFRAWEAGRAVVTTRTGPASLLDPPARRVAYPFAESIVAAVQALLAAPEVADAVGARDRTRLEQSFTWSSVADRLLTRYHAAIPEPAISHL